MPRLPENPNLEHLKKQAKDLLRLYQSGDPEAFNRLRNAFPLAANKEDAAIAALDLKLHDAQSCVAREYGFPTWKNLHNYVDWLTSKRSTDRKDVVALWLHKAYGHDTEHAHPSFAEKRLAEIPDFVQGDLFLACAIGDEATVRQAIAADRSSVNRTRRDWRCPGCKEYLDMPPLIAVAHSTLLQLPNFRDRLHRCARLLLDAGADPNQSWRAREGDHAVSALYGAAGKNHDPKLTQMLLEAGANPNDGESLYHAMETTDAACARLLLEAGAKVEGSNALHHVLDWDGLEMLRLLLSYTKDVNDTGSGLGSPLIWAIRRRRSLAHIEALLEAGANPHASTSEGVSAYKFALQSGLTDVADALRRKGANESFSIEDEFVAACARADGAAARAILTGNPDIFRRLSEPQLRQLPNLMEARKLDAVRLMVELGWPIAVRGADWGASVLSLAVYQGDPEWTRFFLEHGARWTEEHNYGNVRGILGWASQYQPPGPDWLGCARALVEYGMPVPESVHDYSPELVAYFASVRGENE
ncbi:MAG TPA: ankyrin repeat domain-containing protein [Terriglobia bacterium]|nr:ankyrin repeat domain-containing protein [Terriglobia bacterium]